MLLRMASSEYIVKLLDIVRPQSLRKFTNLCLVLECANSDLKKLCKSTVYLEEIHVKTILYNILLGLKYLHSAGIIHWDMKPANVLVNKDCTARLCDFGLARCVNIHSSDKWNQLKIGTELLYELADEPISEYSKHQNPLSRKRRADIYIKMLRNTREKRRALTRELTGHVVTRWYRPPEIILLEKSYDYQVDIWSTGCIYAELLGMMKCNVESFSFRTPLF